MTKRISDSDYNLNYGCDFSKEDHDFEIFYNDWIVSKAETFMVCKKCSNIKGTNEFMSNGDTNW